MNTRPTHAHHMHTHSPPHAHVFTLMHTEPTHALARSTRFYMHKRILTHMHNSHTPYICTPHACTHHIWTHTHILHTTPTRAHTTHTRTYTGIYTRTYTITPTTLFWINVEPNLTQIISQTLKYDSKCPKSLLNVLLALKGHSGCQFLIFGPIFVSCASLGFSFVAVFVFLHTHTHAHPWAHTHLVLFFFFLKCKEGSMSTEPILSGIVNLFLTKIALTHYSEKFFVFGLKEKSQVLPNNYEQVRPENDISCVGWYFSKIVLRVDRLIFWMWFRNRDVDLHVLTDPKLVSTFLRKKQCSRKTPFHATCFLATQHGRWTALRVCTQVTRVTGVFHHHPLPKGKILHLLLNDVKHYGLSNGDPLTSFFFRNPDHRGVTQIAEHSWREESPQNFQQNLVLGFSDSSKNEKNFWVSNPVHIYHDFKFYFSRRRPIWKFLRWKKNSKNSCRIGGE